MKPIDKILPGWKWWMVVDGTSARTISQVTHCFKSYTGGWGVFAKGVPEYFFVDARCYPIRWGKSGRPVAVAWREAKAAHTIYLTKLAERESKQNGTAVALLLRMLG